MNFKKKKSSLPLSFPPKSEIKKICGIIIFPRNRYLTAMTGEHTLV